MKLFRIILGVLVGAGAIAGLTILGRELPGAAPRSWCILMGFGMCGLLAWVEIHCLRIGFAGGKFTNYERRNKPLHFWFYILFYSFLAAFFFAFGMCSLFAPHWLPLE